MDVSVVGRPLRLHEGDAMWILMCVHLNLPHEKEHHLQLVTEKELNLMNARSFTNYVCLCVWVELSQAVGELRGHLYITVSFIQTLAVVF